MLNLEKTILGLECCTQADNKGYPKCERCPYADEKLGTCDAVRGLMKDALSLLKAQEPIVATDGKLLQEFFTDVKASNSILNSVNNHCLTLETVSKIIMLCGPACDVLSPDGFIKWLKDRITDDSRIREEVMQNEKD